MLKHFGKNFATNLSMASQKLRFALVYQHVSSLELQIVNLLLNNNKNSNI